MKLGEYLPSLPKISQEVIATVLGIIGAALIIQQFPRLKKWVRENSIT